MHAFEILLILIMNFIVIAILYYIQKRLVEKSLRHLKVEVQELEDLVAAIIEEFEEIAGSIEDGTQINNEPASESQAPGLVYPTVDDFLDKLGDGDFSEKIQEGIFNENYLPEANFNQNTAPDRPKRVVSEIEPNHNKPETSDNHRQPDGPLPGVLKEDAKSDALVNEELINDPKHRQIINLWRQGTTIEEIARRLEIGRGEIQLVLGIYKRS